jgi:hypothetical protein
MIYEVLEDRNLAHEWRVEWVDTDGEGLCYLASFAGQGARELAIEYAEWKAGKDRTGP